MIELVDLSAQSAVLIGRRAAAFVLLERVERLDPRLVEIELVLRALNLRRDRIAPGRRRFRKLCLQTVNPSADLVRRGVERLQTVHHVAQAVVAGPKRRSSRSSSGRGVRIGLGQVRRLRAGVLESEPQDLAGGLAVVGEK